jgi:tetracenomycin A2 monooxygenase-dioxygenase
VWLRRDGAKVSTLQLPTTGFVLLAGPEGQAWLQPAHAAASHFGVPLRTFRLGHDLTDLEGNALSALGLGAGGALLIRPDGFVTWRSPDAPATDRRPERAVHKALAAATGVQDPANHS